MSDAAVPYSEQIRALKLHEGVDQGDLEEKVLRKGPFVAISAGHMVFYPQLEHMGG